MSKKKSLRERIEDKLGELGGKGGVLEELAIEVIEETISKKNIRRFKRKIKDDLESQGLEYNEETLRSYREGFMLGLKAQEHADDEGSDSFVPKSVGIISKLVKDESE